ncbi:MAG: hypothetical protein V4714_04750 [Bacteroidota bacterium]
MFPLVDMIFDPIKLEMFRQDFDKLPNDVKCAVIDMAQAYSDCEPSDKNRPGLEQALTIISRSTGLAQYTTASLVENLMGLRFLFSKEKKASIQYTVEPIEELKPGEIFVFGSNTSGEHFGGASRYAHDHFGAIWGQAEGLQGNSYGVVTLDFFGKITIGIPFITEQVLKLYHFASSHPELTFFVPKIGSGISGFKIEEIRSIFISLRPLQPDNIVLPKEFY